MKTRKCQGCKFIKPIGEFQTVFLCRKCYLHQYYLEHSEKIKKRICEYTKKYKSRIYARNRKYVLDHYDEVMKNKREYYEKNKNRIVSQHIKYREKNSEKYKCLNKFHHALRTGKIKKRPCSICGNWKSEGHHFDYSKPYDVIWYCRKHHRQSHRLIP